MPRKKQLTLEKREPLHEYLRRIRQKNKVSRRRAGLSIKKTKWYVQGLERGEQVIDSYDMLCAFCASIGASSVVALSLYKDPPEAPPKVKAIKNLMGKLLNHPDGENIAKEVMREYFD